VQTICNIDFILSTLDWPPLDGRELAIESRCFTDCIDCMRGDGSHLELSFALPLASRLPSLHTNALASTVDFTSLNVFRIGIENIDFLK